MIAALCRDTALALSQFQETSGSIEVFHTHDQNHVTAAANQFWGSNFATVGAGDMLSELATNLVKESRNVQTELEAAGISYPC